MVPTGFGNWLLETPIGLIGLVLFLGMGLTAFVGWSIRRRRDQRRGEDDGNEESHESYLISAILGLLALLTGFTFSLALDRFDTRRENVLIEANAIGTTYLRAQLLDEPHRTRMSNMLKEYVDVRLALAEAPRDQQAALLQRNDQLITDLWTATVAAFPTMREYQFSASFLETMNQVIDEDAVRKTARRAHVPPTVFFLLFVYQLVSAGAIGYVLPAGMRGKVSAAVVFLLFGFALMLIVDLDRPTGGRVRESQEPMEALRDSLRTQPPAIFDRFSAPAERVPPPS